MKKANLRSLALIGALLPGLSVFAQADRRNTDITHTDTVFPMPAYPSLDAWKARATQLRRQVLFAAGLDPFPAKPPLRAEVFGRIAHADYTIEKVLLETMPGYWLGGNLYRPAGRPGRYPGIVSPHGHWSYGRLEHQPLGSIPARAINLARQGYVVFAYDMVGYNDTQQTPHAFGGRREQLWNFGPLGLQLWNSIRAVDFLLTLPDVDPGRLGATGASGGGTQTFLLTAVDDRIKWSVPVNMISGLMQGGSACENAPGLRFGANNIEIAALMAPRPMLMVSASGDWTRNTPQNEYPAMKAIYRLFDAEAKLDHVHVDAPHNYNKESREAMYRFFAREALGVASPGKEFAERNIAVEPLDKMLALWGRTLPAGALDYEGVFARWRAFSAGAAPSRDRLMLALGAEWPARVEAAGAAGDLVLSRPGRGDAVRVRATGQPATLVVREDGRREPAADAVVLTAFQTGDAVAPRNRDAKHFLTFNRSDDAERVQDILTGLRWLAQQGRSRVTLRCEGRAALWCTFAAAVAPLPVTLEAPAGGFQGTDAEFAERFFVPGIQRAGGWAAAQALLNR